MRIALAAVLLLPASARPAAEWELLGSRRVSFAAERDVIDVGAREGTFDAIRIEVDGGNLEMYNIRLTFGNGDTWSPNTRVFFRQGSWSRLIDLPGPVRAIRKVEFWYRSRLRRGQATVRVFGRAARVPTDAPAPHPPPNPHAPADHCSGAAPPHGPRPQSGTSRVGSCRHARGGLPRGSRRDRRGG